MKLHVITSTILLFLIGIVSACILYPTFGTILAVIVGSIVCIMWFAFVSFLLYLGTYTIVKILVEKDY